MPLIIDTYNVLHVVGVLPPDLAGIDAPGLIDLIEASRYRGEQATLVCDGEPRVSRVGTGVSEPGGVTELPVGRGLVAVRYSGRGTTADDVIALMIRRSTAPRGLTVVSSDREVIREARRRRCATLTADAFLRQLAADWQRTPGESAGGPPESSSAPSGEEQLPRDVVKEAESMWSAGGRLEDPRRPKGERT